MTGGTTSSGGGGDVQAATDVLEERMIDAEYKIWKKNTPFLYNMVMTHSLEWPSLACQWLPNKRKLGKDSSNCSEEHSLLIGTHTTGEQNYLMVATAIVPSQDDVVVPDDDDDDDDDTKKPAAAASGKQQQQQKQPAPQYDEEKQEVGGFGHANTNVGKISIRMKIKHEGEVNRARYMPQNHFIVATRGPNPEIYIFDRSKHPSMPADNSPFSPQGVCLGHKKEGYGTFLEDASSTFFLNVTLRFILLFVVSISIC
jgi:histone-binding protein RBBP4